MEVQAIQESMQLLSDKLDHARLVHTYLFFNFSDRNIVSRTGGSGILYYRSASHSRINSILV